MVSRRLQSNGDVRDDHGRDRAQLILIGAITLAFIILGLVVVVNSVLLTETLSSGDSGRSGSDAATVEHDIEQGIAGIAHRGNLRWGNDTDSGYNKTISNVVEDDGFRGRYQNVTGNSRPVVVNVSVDGVPEDHQARARTDESVTGLSTPKIDRQVGHLSFDLRSDGDNGTVTVTQNGTETFKITEVALAGGGSGFELTDENGDDCLVGADHAEINLVTGAVNATVDRQCDRTFVDPSKPTELSIEGDSDTSGTYNLVVKEESKIFSIYPTDPHAAAWAVDVTVTYDSSDVSYERPYRVFLYGDRS
ncbi:hypothetical protein [Natrinema sp. CGMCC1.2065]|uniref:hypothetical protein n=1 Tax=Natrinema sp. CGMCC1.2065 TaxID=3445767 RepID=UPI003F4A3AAB